MTNIAYPNANLPPGIRSRFVDNGNGLTVHILEAGFENPGRPCVLFLHGFPELAYSWRRVLLPVAEAGFHVIAPDQRGYGQTKGWDGDYDGDVCSFRIPNLVADALGLISALGYRSVQAVIGHDFGSFVAAYCALTRPDVFQSVVMMSAPFTGAPSLPFDTARASAESETRPDIHAELAALPRPRKHYQWYYSTRAADDDMHHCPEGVHAFLRNYFHHKSADWKANKPFPLESWTASELAKMPTYYIMDHGMNMAETVAQEAPTAEQIAACTWLPDDELIVYSEEFGRTGFQGGLQWYRCKTDSSLASDLHMHSGRTIDVPSCFIAGANDWGIHQVPGAMRTMQESACTQMLACHLVDDAGHWVQQECATKVTELILEFVRR